MKFGLFFGAGAEVEYGLPLGGKFAIDLFRQDNTAEKDQFRENLKSINPQDIYATKWLPESYRGKRIHAFGKAEFRSLIESSIEYRKKIIVTRLNDFDRLFGEACQNCDITSELVAKRFKDCTGKYYGSETYSQVIKINPILASTLNLFESEFYSAVLDVIRQDGDTTQIEKYASSILQLLIGAYGQELVQRVNQEIFTEAPDDLSIFDDITGMFRLEFDRIGNTALDLLLKSGVRQPLGEDASIHDILLSLLRETLELLFTEVLDYQALIDSHWRYLYSPREDWAKFTKMVIFLNSTRNYMKKQLEDNFSKDAIGYYHEMDILNSGNNQIIGIGTANYNNLVEKIAGKSVDKRIIYHLNGSLNDFYNPYKNFIKEDWGEAVPIDQIYVPFMLTQSGVKPLSSINMSRRYVEFYDRLKAVDAIVAIGYNFNVDDNHINGLFRQLVEDESRTLFWVVLNGSDTELDRKKYLEEMIRLPTSTRRRVHIVRVDGKTRKTDAGKIWADAILEKLTEAKSGAAT